MKTPFTSNALLWWLSVKPFLFVLTGEEVDPQAVFDEGEKSVLYQLNE
jgi:hypothetical protein